MDRFGLAKLLTGEERPVQLAGAALDAGASWEVWGGSVPKPALLSIYRRRERTVTRAGHPSIGFEQALDDLDGHDGGRLALGFVDDRPRDGYYFLLFLSADRAELVACLGIKADDLGAKP